MRLRQISTNLLIMLFSLALTFGAVEYALRLLRPTSTFRAATELQWMRDNPELLSKYYTVDPDFGFRPILDIGGYSQYGTLPNEYSLQKQAGKTRVLFIGDSVTARGKLPDALKTIYGEEKYEYWNAGVESFNTMQEVKFYQRYNYLIQPDQVILTFHLNDFEPTPIAFFNEQKQLVVYVPHTPLKPINRWLFEKSYLYRLYVGLSLNSAQAKTAITQEIASQLQSLQDELTATGIRFTVLVLPLFKPYQQWSPNEIEARATILKLLEEQQIRHIDLFEPFQQAASDGLSTQERDGDFWHPSDEMAARFADYLASEHLLDKEE